LIRTFVQPMPTRVESGGERVPGEKVQTIEVVPLFSSGAFSDGVFSNGAFSNRAGPTQGRTYARKVLLH
jgi:hypothetical protein